MELRDSAPIQVQQRNQTNSVMKDFASQLSKLSLSVAQIEKNQSSLSRQLKYHVNNIYKEIKSNSQLINEIHVDVNSLRNKYDQTSDCQQKLQLQLHSLQQQQIILVDELTSSGIMGGGSNNSETNLHRNDSLSRVRPLPSSTSSRHVHPPAAASDQDSGVNMISSSNHGSFERHGCGGSSSQVFGIDEEQEENNDQDDIPLDDYDQDGGDGASDDDDAVESAVNIANKSLDITNSLVDYRILEKEEEEDSGESEADAPATAGQSRGVGTAGTTIMDGH